MNKATTQTKEQRSKAQKEAWYTLNRQSFEDWLSGNRSFKSEDPNADLKLKV